MTEQIFVIAAKDLRLERRSKASLNALVFLAGMILVIISFALGPNVQRLRESAGGVLWIAFAFAAVLAFARAYQTEAENRCFEGLLLSGASPRAIYLGKLIATTTIMLLVEAVVVLGMVVVDSFSPWPLAIDLIPVLLLGTVGIASVGIVYGRLTMTLRAREVMLPLLLFPLIIPALLAGVEATNIALTGSYSGIGVWLNLLIIFDVVFVATGLLLYEALCRE